MVDDQRGDQTAKPLKEGQKKKITSSKIVEFQS
jgi:hypothetical protein